MKNVEQIVKFGNVKKRKFPEKSDWKNFSGEVFLTIVMGRIS